MSVFDRSIDLGLATTVTSERIEKRFCMNNGVVAYGLDGHYFVSPDGVKATAELRKAGFEEKEFVVLYSQNPTQAPRGFETQ